MPVFLARGPNGIERKRILSQSEQDIYFQQVVDFLRNTNASPPARLQVSAYRKNFTQNTKLLFRPFALQAALEHVDPEGVVFEPINRSAPTWHRRLLYVSDKLGRLVAQTDVFCGLLKEDEGELLFGEQANQVGSAAVLMLQDDEKLIAALAIANEDRDYYRDSMSTSMLSYIGEVLAEAIVMHTA